MDRLYEITTELQELLDNGFTDEFINKETGELDTNAVIERIDGLQGDLKVKTNNVALYIKGLESNSVAIDNEIKRLKERKRHEDNKAKRLKEYIMGAMEFLKLDKIETPQAVVKITKSKRVKITDLNELAEKFKRTKIEIEADKVEIKKAIKNGDVVKGAEIVENKSLNIK